MKKIRNENKIILFLKGMGMGVADIIPGVSGGTIALITGIYEQLIASLSSLKIKHILDVLNVLSPLTKKQQNEDSLKNLKEIPWGFILPLIGGIIIAILGASRVIPVLLEKYPIYCYSFFFGLILFSLPIPLQEVKRSILSISGFLIASVGMYLLLSNTTSTEGSTSLPYVFLCGAVAICAMILPGISGAYLLVVFGEYKLILEALHKPDIEILSVFIAGICIGIYSFLRVLKYLLANYHSITMSLMAGIMFGSLKKIWPYTYVDTPPDWILHFKIVGFMLLGVVVILTLSQASRKTIKESAGLD